MELAIGQPAWVKSTQVVIIGSGAAGLSAALHLAAAGIETVILSRADIMTSSTDWAQGGLAAVWDEADSVESHVEDTLVAGAGLCDEQAVRTLVEEAPEAIRTLIELGAKFDRSESGAYDLHLEGGHSARRILHADGDGSGHEVQRSLVAALYSTLADDKKNATITVETGTRAVDILTNNGRACGVRVIKDGVVGEWRAGAVILASGGVGQAWSLTSNPVVATGDGIAMAHRAGAELQDCEFIQFHPTMLAVPRRGGRDVLVSEAVRGDGAFLIDGTGARVMQGKHPRADLAPRDVVATAMVEHMRETGQSHLYLDARHFGAQKWESHFPGILALLRERGVDPVTTPIPVRPGAHYQCGGVAATMNGETSLPSLYTIGEVARTGVQGANRLASNSVTEALVMGNRCGELLAHERPVAPSVADPIDERSQILLTNPNAQSQIRAIMDEYVGVFRTNEGLKEAQRLLAILPVIDKNTAVSDAALDASNMRLAGSLIALAARARRESRGCHRRKDYAYAL